MSELVAEAHRLLDAASAAITASTREPPSTTTAMLARKIVSEAKKQRPIVSYSKASTCMGTLSIGTT